MDPSDLQTVQSIMLVAVKSSTRPELKNDDPELAEYLDHEVSGLIKTDLPVLTDEFAPVDYYTNKAIR